MHPLGRRVLAEALGTALLVTTVVGSGIMAERLAGGNQAIALLGNTIPTGAILVVIITIFGPISGAHFNPAATLVFGTRSMTPWSEVIPYIVVQCLGGIAGTAIAHLSVRFGAIRHRDHVPQRRLPVVRRGCRDLYSDHNDSWRVALRSASHSLARRRRYRDDSWRGAVSDGKDPLCESCPRCWGIAINGPAAPQFQG
jgi:Major intrinsic protein